MPVSVLEAMNAGLLVISSRVGGVPYMINEDKSGLLFESDNADELAEKMLWALEHPEEVKQIITQAQIEVQKYSWENIRQQLMKLYE
jgi:glycosyltransferase involved in cell wall biosynthesis